MIVFLHGFDSSSLEYRRLRPLLSSHRCYFLDIHGWGFGSYADKEYGPEEKLEKARTFIRRVGNLEGVAVEDIVVAGASLGGAVAQELCLDLNLVGGLILLNSQSVSSLSSQHENFSMRTSLFIRPFAC